MTNTLRAEALDTARQEALASGLHRLIVRGIKQAERDHPEIAVGNFRGSVAKRVAPLILADYDMVPKAKTGAGERPDTTEALHDAALAIAEQCGTAEACRRLRWMAAKIQGEASEKEAQR